MDWVTVPVARAAAVRTIGLQALKYEHRYHYYFGAAGRDANEPLDAE
jgi:hypothetical protein